MDIKKSIRKLIEKYDKIIIHRHKNPDGDAIGSQYGLALTLKHNFRNKKVFVVGDINDRIYQAKMDEIDDKEYNDALAIICDTSASHMISDDRYNLASERIVIDHHQNDTDLDNLSVFYKDSNYSSASAMIVDLLREWKLDIPSEAATYLYGGIVTDTGRFLYLKENNAKQTLELASYIVQFNPDINGYYDYLYVEPLKMKQAKAMFSSFELTENNVAYRKNPYDLVLKSGLDFFSVSRGMVNQMAGIKEVKIWVNFTENEKNEVIAEIRSRGITVVDIAKNFGGGGHNEACGATLGSFNEAELMLIELNERARENE